MGDNKLAKDIRACTSSEQFDLSNYTKARLEALVVAAFTEPIESKDMIALTFVVGGGKNVRQKYSPDMPKQLSQALKDIGFTEDRGASCTMACQGMFKFQHDTDKDLKFIHVFPKVVPPQVVEDEDDDVDDLLVVGVNNLRVHSQTPALICAAADMDDFKRLVVEYCPSFSQRKRLLMELKQMVPSVTAIEEKMARMESLDDAEDELYNNIDSLSDKIEGLSGQIEGMMTRGHLTKAEINAFLPDLRSKGSKLDQMIEGMKSKGKKTAKLEEQKQQLTEKIDALVYAQGQRCFVPKSPCWPDIEQELTSLRKREANSISVDPKILRRIDFLMTKKAGWYSECIPKEPEPVRVKKVVKGAGSTSSSSSSSSSSGWATAGGKKKSSKGRSRNQAVRNQGGPNLFAMLGDDSD